MPLSKEAREYFAKFGRKGARRRLEKMTPEQRQAVARNAAKARWAKNKNSPTGQHDEK